MNALQNLLGYSSDDDDDGDKRGGGNLDERSFSKKEGRKEEEDIEAKDAAAEEGPGEKQQEYTGVNVRNRFHDLGRMHRTSLMREEDTDEGTLANILPDASSLLGPGTGAKRPMPSSGRSQRLALQPSSKLAKTKETDGQRVTPSRGAQVTDRRRELDSLVPTQVRGRANVSTQDPSIFTKETQLSMMKKKQKKLMVFR